LSYQSLYIMKITDFENIALPIRVKLTAGFTLDESFDPGMIIQINHFTIDEGWGDGGDLCYKVNVAALASDYKHNSTVAHRDWFDKDGQPTLTIFEHRQGHKKDYNPETDDWYDEIYVMGSDDAFKDMTSTNITHNSFIELCRSILRIKGVETKKHDLNFYSSYAGDGNLIKFEDDSIAIVGAESDLSLCITRKENSNPVVYVDKDGKTFRSHGEQKYLYLHVKRLIEDLI
jgi:hypothetical protein